MPVVARIEPASGFVDPATFRSLPAIGIVSGSVIKILRSSFLLSEAVFPEGSEVLVQSGQYFTATSTKDLKEERSLLDRKIAEDKIQADADRNAKDVGDRVFNTALCPVAFSAQIKPVISGLSSRGNGCGSRANSVIHVYLQEDLNVGRLHRKAGSFLCSPSIGAHYNDVMSEVVPGRISCKACLSKLETIRGVNFSG